MPGSALGAFITNHDNISGPHLTVLNSCQAVFLGIEHASRALENEAFFAGELGHGTLGSQVSVEDLRVTGLLNGAGQRADDGLAVLKCFGGI